MKRFCKFLMSLLVFTTLALPSLRAASNVKLYSNIDGVNTWKETAAFTIDSDTTFYLILDAAAITFDFYFRIEVDNTQWGPDNKTYYSAKDHSFTADDNSSYASEFYFGKAFALEYAEWGGYSQYLIVGKLETDEASDYINRWNISVYGLDVDESYELDVNSSPVPSTEGMTNHSTWWGYTSISSACNASNLYTKLCEINPHLDILKSYGWTLVKKLKLNGKLNYADVYVLHWMANHNALYVEKLTKDQRFTGGKLEELDLSDATFCVETLNSAAISLSIFVDYNADTKAVQRITPGYASTSETELPSDVFAYTHLKEVKLNDNTTRILQSAFRECIDLEHVDFPSKLQEIVKFAFWPTKMTDVDLTVCPQLTAIGEKAFMAETTPGAYPKNVYFPANEITFGPNVFNLGNKTNLTRSDVDLYFPMSVMDYSRGVDNLSNYCSDENMRFAPMLEKGNWIRTFSFDRDLNYNSIHGKRTDKSDIATQELQAYRAAAYDKTLKTVTLQSASMKLANGQGVVIKGEGVTDEFYPIPPSDGDTDGYTNYMKGSADATLSVPTHPTYYSTAFILLTDGEFYYSTGGTLPKYKAYLQTPERILVITDPGYAGSPSSVSICWDNTTTGISSVQDRQEETNGSVYTLDGRKVSGMQMKKGIYIRNGRKEVVR